MGNPATRGIVEDRLGGLAVKLLPMLAGIPLIRLAASTPALTGELLRQIDDDLAAISPGGVVAHGAGIRRR